MDEIFVKLVIVEVVLIDLVLALALVLAPLILHQQPHPRQLLLFQHLKLNPNLELLPPTKKENVLVRKIKEKEKEKESEEEREVKAGIKTESEIKEKENETENEIEIEIEIEICKMGVKCVKFVTLMVLLIIHAIHILTRMLMSTHMYLTLAKVAIVNTRTGTVNETGIGTATVKGKENASSVNEIPETPEIPENREIPVKDIHENLPALLFHQL